MFGLRRRFSSYAFVALGVLLTSHVEADHIDIVNAGFESPPLSSLPGYTDNYIPGWDLTVTNANGWDIGVENPNRSGLFPLPQSGGAYEGENLAYHNRGGFSQTLSDTLAANTMYTLTVQQNLTAANKSTAGTWHVDLLAAGSPLVSVSDTIASLTRDTWVLRTLQYTTGSSVAAGQPLGIRFTLIGSADATDVGWDDVQLDATAVRLLGDVNLDGEVNGLDVDPFVEVLLSGPYQAEADMNEDQVVNGLDVEPFVAAVVGGTQPVPEPSTFLLTLVALAVLSGLRKRRG